jgi:hypothetical protein
LLERGGNDLLQYFYNGSLTEGIFLLRPTLTDLALSTIYPEHNWKFWKMSNVPASQALVTSQDVSLYVDDLAKKLKIQHWDDWYRVSAKQLKTVDAYNQVNHLGGLRTLLNIAFPDRKWNNEQLWRRPFRPGQRWLKVILSELFPNIGTDNCSINKLMTVEIYEDYIHPELVFRNSGRPMQLDIFIPSLSLAFEYQGIHHFKEVFYWGKSLPYYKENDKEKRAACGEKITLIEVPYWWDNTKESVAATIHAKRPDLLSSFRDFDPISLTEPSQNKHSMYCVRKPLTFRN